jgi:uncharacterized integral membrane protein (TIGR00698 family)
MTQRLRHLWGFLPGTSVALLIALTAAFLAELSAAPEMLCSLLLGMGFNFLNEHQRMNAGIAFAASALLRLGVALLGVRIGVVQIAQLGWEPMSLVILLVCGMIGTSILLARAMGFNPLFGFLSGGATAICGASAALAISTSLPPHERKEELTLFTVIVVSALSTLAMITYPFVTDALGFDDRQAGLFLGATIHDVAQVVGAGYAISPEAGDTAIIVKLMRVTMLLPVIIVADQIARRQKLPGSVRAPLLPWFLVAFVGLVALNSALPLPEPLTATAGDVSRWCLVTSLAAIGMKTRIGELMKVGIRPIIIMIVETLTLAVTVLATIKIGLI